MANFIFNQALGRLGNWWEPDTIRLGLLKAKEADNALRDHDTVSAMLGAAGNTEADCTGYSRPYSFTITQKHAERNHDSHYRAGYASNYFFGNLGGATNNTLVGLWTYKFVTNDAGSTPISWHEFDYTTAAGIVTVVEWSRNTVWRAWG